MFSIDLHKKLMWIPLVNLFTIVTFPFTIRGIKVGERAWWMLFVYAFGAYFAGSGLLRLVASLLPKDSPVVSICSLYLFPVFVNYVLVKYREKYLIF